MLSKAFMVAAAFALALTLPQRATAQSPRLPSHNFKFEMQNDTQGRPQVTITNLSSKTLTAAAIEFSVSSEIQPQGNMEWDAVVQRGPVNHPEAQHPPLEPGARMTMYVPHPVGGPTPDAVEIVAGIWSDGETFGNPQWVKNILDVRARFAAGYEQAIALLQKGLAENWTRDQYVQALNESPQSFTDHTIRSNLERHPQFDQDAKLLQHALKNLLAYFSEALSQIRSAKP